MIKPLEKILDRVQELSAERQAVAAELLEIVVDSGDDVYELSPEELHLIDVGLDELDRGEFKTEADALAVLDKYR